MAVGCGGRATAAAAMFAFVLLPASALEPNCVRLDVYPTIDGRIVPDLTREEFDIVEDGAPQTIEGLIRVTDPPTRRFVLFLDTYHTKTAGAQVSPLIGQWLQKITADRDLIATMTPDMSIPEVTFARRADALQTIASKPWWGRRDSAANLDRDETAYVACFAHQIAEEMIARRREKLLLDTLRDLVGHLRGIPGERKAVVIVSEGWTLFGPDRSLSRDLSRNDRRANLSEADCARDRMTLSRLDSQALFRDLLGDANRANVSFYAVHPLALAADVAAMPQRQSTLRTLATGTDGAAAINSGDTLGVLQRAAEDLRSYYFLSFVPTNTKLDGKVRRIKVTVKRPGVVVRARPGYRAATAAELKGESAATTEAPKPAEPGAVARVLERLGGIRPDATWRVHAAPAPMPEGDLSATLWVSGELDYFAAKSADWKDGGELEITLSTLEGRRLASTRATLAAGTRTVLVKVTMPPGSEFDGSARVIARLRPAGGGAPLTATTRASWPDEPGATPAAALLFRRGPTTAQAFVPTADLRFRRGEQVRVQVPFAGDEAKAAARILDRQGQAVAAPITAAVQRDADGASWIVAEASFAPLLPADYAIEVMLARMNGRAERILVPVRIVP